MWDRVNSCHNAPNCSVSDVRSVDIHAVGWLFAEFVVAWWNAVPEKATFHPQITQIYTDYLKENLRKSA